MSPTGSSPVTPPTYDDAVTDRWIDLDGLANMRDVGGLPTVDGGRTVPGRLIRSDNLQDLTDTDIARLVDELGVTDVVDLRSVTELHLEGPGPLRRVQRLAHHHHSLAVDKGARTAEEAARHALLLRESGERAPRDHAFWARHYLGYLDGQQGRYPEAVEHLRAWPLDLREGFSNSSKLVAPEGDGLDR